MTKKLGPTHRADLEDESTQTKPHISILVGICAVISDSSISEQISSSAPANFEVLNMTP
jgi:hypothetical protein